MNTTYEAIRVLTPEELEKAAGGTFTPNTYTKEFYHMCGISTCYNFFSNDEFRFMGRGISYDMANDICATAKRVNEAMNAGHHGANQIGYGENIFIAAFNSQLLLKYGIVWDGNPGVDF